MTSMEVDGAGTSSARRRRERRLRSWWRHERMSVAAALAEAHHHSAPKVGAETHYALRRQKTASAGARPGVLKDPAPQGAVTVGYVAAPGSLLCTPLLADTAADTVDARTVKYLLHAALKEKKEEEKEERRKAKEARRLEVTALLAVPLALRTQAQQRRIMELSDEVDAETHPKRRKRKKRRKRRTPRTSSLPSRARRRQRQWSACYAGFTGYDTPRVMFPSVDARPKMLCIMAGMHQEDSYAVFAGDDAPRAVPSRFHRCSSWTIYWPVVCIDRFSGPGAVLGQVLTCPLLCLTGEVGPDSTKKQWNCRCCSSSTVADVAASCSDKLLQFSRREQQVCTVQTVHFPWRSPRCCSWTRLSCPFAQRQGSWSRQCRFTCSCSS